jgi:hypothetical protein
MIFDEEQMGHGVRVADGLFALWQSKSSRSRFTCAGTEWTKLNTIPRITFNGDTICQQTNSISRDAY